MKKLLFTCTLILIAASLTCGNPAQNSYGISRDNLVVAVPDTSQHGPLTCDPVTTFPYSESFDGTTFPPECWVLGYHYNSTHTWSRVTSGSNPTCSPHSGAGMAEFDETNTDPGQQGFLITKALSLPNDNYMVDFWMYRDDGNPSYGDAVYVYYNTTPDLNGGQIALGSISRYYGSSPAESIANQWYEYHFYKPGGSSGSPGYFIFNVVPGRGKTIFIDDVSVVSSQQTLKTLASATVTQADVSVAYSGSVNNAVLMIDYLVNSGGGALNLNSVTVTSANSDASDADIAASGVKLYWTSTPGFSTSYPLGTAKSLVSHTATFSGLSFSLPAGHTYVWVTYNIASAAVSGHTVDAKILAGGMNVGGATYNSTTDDPSGNRTISDVEVAVSQASVAGVLQGSSNQQILMLDLNKFGTNGTLLNSIAVTSANSDLSDADIAPSGVKLYRTSTSTFSTANLLGTAQDFVANTANFSNLAYALPVGHTYVWVTYDISPTAAGGHTVDAKILANAINVGGTSYPSTLRDPAGSRSIVCDYVTALPYTESFDGETFPPSCWANPSSYPWSRVTVGNYPSCDPHSGNGMAEFNAWNYVPGFAGGLITKGFILPNESCRLHFWMYRDNGYPGSAPIDDRVAVYYNTVQQINGSTSLGTIYRYYQESPAETTPNQWYEYYFDLPTGLAGSPVYFVFYGISNRGNNIFIDDVTISIMTPKTLASVNISQGPVTEVSPGSTGNPVLMMDYNVTGELGPLKLNSVAVTSANTTDSDVTPSGVNLYYTSTPEFSTANHLGTAQSFISGNAVFTDLNYDLPKGHTYVWVAYDISPTAAGGHTVDAKILAGGMNVGGATYNSTTDDPSGNRTISYVQVAVSQASVAGVLQGSSNQQILMVDLNTFGTNGTLLNSIAVTSANSDLSDTDIAPSGVKLYRTSTSTFSTANLLGTAQDFVANTANFSNLAYALPAGHTYVWVTYDISPTAIGGHILDAKILANAINVGGTSYPSTLQDPAGSRSIACDYVTALPYTESFDGETFPPLCWANPSSFPWSRVTLGNNPPCDPHSGNGMAEFNSSGYLWGYAGELITKGFILPNESCRLHFWMYRDDGYPGSAPNDDRVAVYYNTVQQINGSTDLGTIYRYYQESPAETTPNQWYEYYFDLPTGLAGSPVYFVFYGISNYGNNIFMDDVSISVVHPKTLNSVSVTQGPVTEVSPGSNGNPILMLDYNVSGELGTLKLNSVAVTSANTADSDVTPSGVNLYYTSTPEFSTANHLGTAQSFLSNDAVFTGLDYAMPEGHTYVWVTYDISPTAAGGHTLDAKILVNAINVGGTTYPSTLQDPSGSRSITCDYVTALPYTESFDEETFPPLCWANPSSFPWSRVTLGNYPPCDPHSGNGMAEFNSFSYLAGWAGGLITKGFILPGGSCRLHFWMYRDDGFPGSASNDDRVAVYYNTVQQVNGSTDLGTIYRYYQESPAESTPNQWYEYYFDLPAGLAGSPVYFVFYGVSNNNNNMYLDDVSVRTYVPSSRTLNLSSVFLEGFYNGYSTMFQAQQLFPGDVWGPYWTDGSVDHISVELHASADYSTVIYASTDVPLSTTGTATASIPVEYNGTYYLAIRQRNHLETVSALPLSFSGATITYAFDAFSQAFDGNMTQVLEADGVTPSPPLIFGGDVNQDGEIESDDINAVGNDAAAYVMGFGPTDIVPEGQVESADINIVGNNAALYVFSHIPM